MKTLKFIYAFKWEIRNECNILAEKLKKIVHLEDKGIILKWVLKEMGFEGYVMY
jgi:hypothetical protein